MKNETQAKRIHNALKANKGKDPIEVGVLAIQVAAPIASVRRAIGTLRNEGVEVETFRADNGAFGYNLPA
jgi:hypothetical protein